LLIPNLERTPQFFSHFPPLLSLFFREVDGLLESFFFPFSPPQLVFFLLAATSHARFVRGCAGPLIVTQTASLSPPLSFFLFERKACV